MEERKTRKFAVIMHADVVSSTSLVQRNETLAHDRIREAFHRLTDSVNAYGGTLHEVRGDALVAEFARPSDAVCAALLFQQVNTEYVAQLGDDIVPIVRVGIALGEEVFADATVTGSGVVLAQRVEQLSEPGGVCVTGAIHEAIPQWMPFDQTSLAEQNIKGFEEPVRVYRVALKQGAVVPEAEAREKVRWGPLRLSVVIGFFALFIAGGMLFWLRPWMPQEAPLVSMERAALPLPDKPSIAVLPFTNMSGDPEQDYFVDGITEDIITALSRFKELFVIARSSTFAYKGQSVKSQRVAKELGVHYVLEGSVRSSTERLRITAQLVDARSGGNIWSQSYDRELTDIFALQDNITQGIVPMMAAKVDETELARAKLEPAASLDAYDYVLRADKAFDRFSREDNVEARALYEKAIEYDTEYARAYTGLAGTHERDFVFGWGESPSHSLRLAEESAQKAIALDPSDYKARNELGWLRIFRKQHDEGMAELNKAIALNPNDADILAYMGLALVYVGNPGQALETVEKAIRLNPFHPDWYWDVLAFAYYYNHQYEEAAKAAKRVAKPWAGIYRELAASYVQLGRMKDAQDAAGKVLEIEPDFTTEIFKESMPFKEPTDADHYLHALSKAGLP